MDLDHNLRVQQLLIATKRHSTSFASSINFYLNKGNGYFEKWDGIKDNNEISAIQCKGENNNVDDAIEYR